MAKYSLNQLRVFKEAAEKNLLTAQTKLENRKPHQSLEELLNGLGKAEAQVDHYTEVLDNYGKTGNLVRAKVMQKGDFPKYLWYHNVVVTEVPELVKRDMGNVDYRILTVKTFELGKITY